MIALKMDYETMDHLTEDRGGDLSSFAMLLLEPDNRHRHGDSRDGSALIREKSPRVVGRRPTQLSPNYLQQQSNNQYLQNRHFSMTIDDRVPSQLSPTCIPSPSSPLPNVSGIRGFFRKRHKSVGNSSPLPNQGPQPDPEGTPGHTSTPPKTPPSNNSGQSSGGSKIRNLFFGSSKNKQKADPMSYFSVSLHEPVTRHSSLKQRHESIAIDSPATRRNANSCYGDVIHEGDDDYDYGSSSHRLLYGNIYHTPQQQSYLNSPAGGGSRHFSLMQKRSCSVRDVVGPVEFVEMFRCRANSEAQKSFQLDSLSNKSKTPRQVSGNLSNSSNSTPDYCPFEPRQVIIWKDSTNGTQVFRLPSNEDEEKLMRQSPDEDDCPDMAYLRFLKSHPCYDVIPTSTKLIVLDTFLTVKKAFHALNDNRIHAAPLWDTKKQDFIGMLTITDFIRVLLQCHRDKMSILQNSEDHTLAYWAESLFGIHRQEMLYVTPDESMYEAINKLLSFKIHRLPIMDVATGNILYVITLKRILRYLYLFFQHYNIPHPYFMNQTLVELNVGTYQDLALVTAKTKLSDALEMMINRRVSSLPIVNNTNKLVGIFNKNLMMGLDSEEAYADLGISIGQVFNGTTIVSAKTCLKTDFYQDVVGKIVNSEVHRVIVVDGNGRVEGVISCSDVMRHMVSQWEDLTSILQVGSSTSMNSDC